MAKERLPDHTEEGRKERFVDEDRMVSEGLGGGYVTDEDNARIGETTVDTMHEQESVLKPKERSE